MLALEGLSYVVRGNTLLNDVTSTIADHALTCLIGANGAGKTTLLRILVGELRATSGRFLIDRTDASLLKPGQVISHCSIIPQDVQPPPHLTVSEVVALGRFRPRRALWWRLQKQDREIVQACLKMCRVDHLTDRRMDQLSGGEQQRVWVAFGLAQQKRFLLLDETLSGIDILARGPFFQMLKRIANEDRGVVLTTHDLDLVSDFADRVVVLSKGRITYQGPPTEDLRRFLVYDGHNGESANGT